MNDQELNKIREQLWRGKPSGAELEKLRALSETDQRLKKLLDEELPLSLCVNQLPEAPAVSSNFTSLVMQKIRSEARAGKQINSNASSKVNLWRTIFRNRLAPASFVLALIVTVSAGWRINQVHQRTVMANEIAAASEAFSSSPEISADIQSIRQLPSSRSQDSQPDVELLVLMK